MADVRLITLDPGHFHAALVQKEMYPQVDPKVHVYAPLGTDLTAHINRIVGFNQRPHNPTAWELEIHAREKFLDQLLEDKPGNVVVLSGRNKAKIDYILAAVNAGLNVLADKPWVLVPQDFAKLQQALELADDKGLVAYDIMTERYEITSILQRELVNDLDTFGTILPGTAEEPSVYMESVHYLMKRVAGVPLRRPEWFFDTTQVGEGLTDVGTHLVDLVPWILFPDQPIDYQQEIQLLSAKRWPTVMSKADYQKVTGETDFPSFLADLAKEDQLEYFCNNSVSYTLRNVHVKLDVLWGFEAEAGAGDSHLCIIQGSNSNIEIRQGKEEKFRPELYVVPKSKGDLSQVGDALKKKVSQLQALHPGVSAEQKGERWWVTIPDQFRVGHEAHFAEVTLQFLQNPNYLINLPDW